MVEKETVLELGVEGGGATIFRTRSDTGEWHFHVEGSSMYLDENDDEVWRSWSTIWASNSLKPPQQCHDVSVLKHGR